MEYVRGDLKLSDHRSVSATFMAEVEVVSHRKLKKACVYPKDLQVDTKVYLKFTPILAIDRMHSNEVPGGISIIRAINYSSYMALANMNFLVKKLVGELERFQCLIFNGFVLQLSMLFSFLFREIHYDESVFSVFLLILFMYVMQETLGVNAQLFKPALRKSHRIRKLGRSSSFVYPETSISSPEAWKEIY